MKKVKFFIHEVKIQLEKKTSWGKEEMKDLINMVYLEMIENELNMHKQKDEMR